MSAVRRYNYPGPDFNYARGITLKSATARGTRKNNILNAYARYLSLMNIHKRAAEQP